MNRGLFKPMVMFFGLTNAPTTFQSMINHLFCELIDEGYVTIYMDNILIHTPNDPALHHHVVNNVLHILTVNDLYLKPQKCQFEQTKVKYLCYDFSLFLTPTHDWTDSILRPTTNTVICD